MTDLEKAKDLLIAGNYTCVLCKWDAVHHSTFRGVRPLTRWYADGADFSGFSAADKVVGKATAFLYALLNVEAVYAGVISHSALAVLEAQGIRAEYGTLVENIINRKGDGICPFELSVLEIRDKQEAYRAIRAKMTEMGIEL